MMNQDEEVIAKEVNSCKHSWNKITGIFEPGKPHVRIKGKLVRTCVYCGKREVYSKGPIFFGWYSE